MAGDRTKLIINPETDFIANIDISKTFMEGGGLAVIGGLSIVPVVHGINMKFPFNRRFASKDRHPFGHISLASSYVGQEEYTRLTLEMAERIGRKIVARHALFTYEELIAYLKIVGFQMLWPDHAVAGTTEAELYPSLLESDFMYVQTKGMNPRVDSYSAFFDNVGNPTGLADVILDCMKLKKGDCVRGFFIGLAKYHCVGYSALDAARKLGWSAYIIDDATRAVQGMPDYDKDMERQFAEAHVQVIYADDLVMAQAA